MQTSDCSMTASTNEDCGNREIPSLLPILELGSWWYSDTFEAQIIRLTLDMTSPILKEKGRMAMFVGYHFHFMASWPLEDLGPDSIEKMISSQNSSQFSSQNSSQNYTLEIWVHKKFGHVSETKWNLKLFFKPKLMLKSFN